ncbi:MAG: hypothetical protein QG657_1320, partial [Acidobacteriota bacterium]|nr:hypothetical protein [Acidobacteriota bacterium]
KARGGYDSALRICDEAIAKFPDEVVPRTIKTEILKARGDYDEAMRLCNDTIQRFPQDVVLRNIKSEILKARGDYDEAMRLCNETIQRFPQEVVPRTIKTEILKARGDYDEALRLCNENITIFPFNTVVKRIKLTILFLMGTLKESEFPILDKTPKTDDDFIEYHLLGMFYLKKGNFDEALKIFDYGIKNANTYESRRYFFSALCVAKIRQNKYRETRDLLLKNEDPLNLIPLNRLLLIHSTAALGDIPGAEKISQNFVSKEAHLSKLKTSLIYRYELNRGGEPPVYDNIENLDRIIREEEEYLLLEREIYPLAA